MAYPPTAECPAACKLRFRLAHLAPSAPGAFDNAPGVPLSPSPQFPTPLGRFMALGAVRGGMGNCPGQRCA